MTVPTGLAAFQDEMFNQPLCLTAEKYVNIVQFSELPQGGHFAALQEPKLLAEDVFSFVNKVEQLQETAND